MALPSSAGRAPRARHIIGLAVAFSIFSSPTLWQLYRPDQPPYALITVVLTAVLAVLVARWPQPAPASASIALTLRAFAVVMAAFALVGFGINRWVDVLLWQPLDASRGDMLVVIQAAIRSARSGHNPYAIYHVPWDAPLPYGPVMWVPFVLPQILQIDLRVITIIGEAFVPVWIAVTAYLEAARGRTSAALAWLALLAAVVFNPELLTFTAVGHTPSYWPLIPLFAVFATTEQWLAAAVVLGLLVVGRSTMVAIVPVFLMAVWWRARPKLRWAVVFAAVPLIALLVPFIIWNPATIWDGMVASYPRVMKGIVWTSPDGGAIKTIGITGWLLAHHLQRFVEAAQAVVLAAVYAAAWRAIGSRRAAPLPWMAFALFGFSMTTLWPVYYVYFDVLLLFASGAIAEALDVKRGPIPIVTTWGASLIATSFGVWLVFNHQAPAAPVVDVGAGFSQALYKGFVPGRDELSGSAAIWGTEATLSLPRRSTAAADIVISGQPVVAAGAPPQGVTATLNGTFLGTVFAGSGWSNLTFHAPAAAWRAGSNVLDLQCTSSAAPTDVGLGSEARHISLAIRRVEVSTP